MWSLRLLWTEWKRINYLNSLLSTRKRTIQHQVVPFWMQWLQSMFANNYDSSFCFWVFEKRLTQGNCFLFCKKYGLFNGFTFLSIKKFLHGQRLGGGGGGGQDLSISYLKQNCFSHGRVRSKNLYTNSFTRNELWNFRLMFLKTLALMYGFLLY